MDMSSNYEIRLRISEPADLELRVQSTESTISADLDIMDSNYSIRDSACSSRTVGVMSSNN